MTDDNEPSYRHTQGGPWGWILYATSVPMVVAGVGVLLAGAVPTVVLVVLPPAAALMLVLGASFQHLTVADEGDRLAIRFGPLPLFAKRIRYEDMQGAELGRTTLLDGWGIHYSPRGGWVWNIWGRGCVVIRHGGGKTWVGTDDGENLLRFLQTKLPSPAGDGLAPLARQEVGR
jgi:hypothetical protein